MVIKTVILIESLKRALTCTGKFVKKYWQLCLGFLSGILTFVIFNSRRGANKAAQEIAKINQEARNKNIKISEDKSGKIDQAVKDFIENDSNAAKDHEEKIKEIDSKAEKIKSDLLEREDKSPGTIAKEINKIVD